ncbi:hypothetical protein MBLNU230_g4391t1 [Neophaeotheca triangularis]
MGFQQDTLPADLQKAWDQLDHLFWVGSDKLRQISQRFQEELQEGKTMSSAQRYLSAVYGVDADSRQDWKKMAATLSGQAQEFGFLRVLTRKQPMNITWVLGFPHGHERGSFLTLDVGGTNLRVCWITLKERQGETDVAQNSYKLPDGLKEGDAEELWGFCAESLQAFINEQGLRGTAEEPLPLGFTFSYPAMQKYIDHGVLQTWTKGLQISGVEGHDAAGQLREVIEKKNLPVRLVALINDTTGAMIASAYNDADTIVGAIFGTGCNAAYMEDCGSIPKLGDIDGLSADTHMAINCEYGAFDNGHRVLPRTKYDVKVDEGSPKPGEQTFEKLSAGLYLGEIFRLVLVDLQEQGLIFQNEDIALLQQPYILDTAFLTSIEDDTSVGQTETAENFHATLSLTPSDHELVLFRRLAEAIAVRSARLCTCGIIAMCRKKGIKSGHVAADGSVANKHPQFKKRWAKAMAEVLEWPDDRREDPIIITSAEDGSGVGAAVISAMTLERINKGHTAGISEEAVRKMAGQSSRL